MSGHTPGPWDREDVTVFALDETRSINRFSVNVQGGYVCRQQGWNSAQRTSDEELLANARLIAAAPDLLAELEHVVRLLKPELEAGRLQAPGFATFNGAERAIAKARGAA